MALTRKFLTALGINADQADEIITAHTETVNALKEERDKYKKDVESMSDMQAELDAFKADNKASFKVKYEALKEEFEAYKNEQTEKENNAKKESAYRDLLKSVNISEKRIDAIMKVTDLKELKLNKDGQFDNAGDLKKAIKDEWSDFIVTEQKNGVKTPNPAGNNGGKTLNRDEIMKITDTTERQKAWAVYLAEQQKG